MKVFGFPLSFNSLFVRCGGCWRSVHDQPTECVEVVKAQRKRVPHRFRVQSYDVFPIQRMPFKVLLLKIRPLGQYLLIFIQKEKQNAPQNFTFVNTLSALFAQTERVILLILAYKMYIHNREKSRTWQELFI